MHPQKTVREPGHRVFYFIPLRHLSCRKTTISTEQEYNVSKTKSGYSAGPLNGEHIAKLPYFA